MRLAATIAAFALLALFAAFARGEEPALFSGPQVGEKLPSLKVTLISADDSHSAVDLIELAAGRPTLLVFVNGANAPAAQLVRALMNFAEMRGDKLAAGVVYLGNERSAAEKFLAQPAKGWWASIPVGATTENPEGPGSYGLNRNVNLTVLVAHKGIVTANFPLIQAARTDVQNILKDVVPLCGGTVPTTAEAAYISLPTRYATADVKLRELLCAGLAAQDEAVAQSAAAAVEEYVASDKTRQADLGNALTTFLARSELKNLSELAIIDHLRTWRKDYGPAMREKKRR